MNCFSELKRARFQNGRECERVGVDVIGEHLNIEIECLLVEIFDGVGVDDSGVGEDIRVSDTVEDGDRVIKAVERGVRALELKGQNWVVIEAVADEGSVDSEELGDRFRIFN